MADEKLGAVILTGATGGLGRAAAHALAQRGYPLVLCGRSAQSLARLAEELAARESRTVTVAGDLGDPAYPERVVAEALEEYGQIGALINNAGAMYLSALENLEVADWMEMVDINLKGALGMIGAVLPNMLDHREGHIINISSISGRMVGPGNVVYAATKHALDTLTEGLRQEMAARNIRVTGIQPGGIATDINEKIRNEGMRRFIKARTNAYRPLAPEEVAATILFALEQPHGVNIGSLFVLPSNQKS